MLNICALSASRGGIPVLHRVSLCVKDHAITAILGANGAGKTTLLSVLAGLVPPSSGTVLWDNKSLLPCAPEEILRQGIAFVPEGRRVFADLSVTENLIVGGTILPKRQLRVQVDAMFSLFPKLYERKKTPAGMLSGGEQQMLAMARALMNRPRLLLLDEPSLGLSPAMAKQIYTLIQKLTKKTAVLLVEQNAKAALSISEEAYGLSGGTVVFSGQSRALLCDSKVQKAYLGSN